MAVVRPFQGIMYDPRRVDMSKVVAPPYDVISTEDRQRYYDQDPHNVVRLIAGEVRTTDSAEDSKYVRAARVFTGWLREVMLRREPQPSMYVYRDEFVDATRGSRGVRQGILMVAELAPFGTCLV